MTFRQLCDHLGRSPMTVRKYVQELGLAPKLVGTAKTWSAAQVKQLEARSKKGGRWPK